MLTPGVVLLLFLDDVCVGSSLLTGTFVARTTITDMLKLVTSLILHDALDDVARRIGFKGRLGPKISRKAKDIEPNVGGSSPIKIFVLSLSRFRISQWFVIVSYTFFRYLRPLKRCKSMGSAIEVSSIIFKSLSLSSSSSRSSCGINFLFLYAKSLL